VRRTKEWWATLEPRERSELVYLEKSEKYSSGYGGGGYLPDDCCECGACGTPHISTGLCNHCLNELIAIIAKANTAMAEVE